MKPELLSPAGNYDSLVMAVLNGADAVYLAGKSFGARKFAGNFTNEELSTAVCFAHLYGVKVYITVNIIVYEDEVKEFISYISYLYKIGVDALIMQDIGMISLVRKRFPNMEIHASTQMHNHNDYGFNLLEELGVARIVLDREMSLNEIKKLSTSLEKEVFIHGALCISYSGCCLFSSMNGGRSGNRGECTQSCRLPYKLMKNDEYIDAEDKYLLSTKELNTMEHFSELMKANIDSFKIEGRMKSASYVGYVTRLYRKLIDNFYTNKFSKINEEEYDNLKILFNREFTSGYLFSDDIMNLKSSNHQGLEIGKVIFISDKKIKIELYKDLYQMDGIRFKNSNLGMNANMIYNDSGLLINSAKKGDIIYLDNKINLKEKDIVLKTSSKYLEDEIEKTSYRKVKININVVAKKNQKLVVSFDDGENTVSIFGNVISEAINRATTRKEIEEKLAKLGNTPFEVCKFDILIDDNIFINMKELNNLRRKLVEELTYERTKIKRKVVINDDDLVVGSKENNALEIIALVRNKEQMDTCLKNRIDRIYADYDLYLEYKDYSNVYLRLPRVMGNGYDNIKNVLVTELGGIKKYFGSNMVSDYYLNVVNNYTIYYLISHGVKRITISPEISDDRLEVINTSNIELIIYGRIELMITKYCPLKKILNHCLICMNNSDKFYLVDAFHNKYPIVQNNCFTHIMHYKNIDKLDSISKYRNMGIKSYRLELFDEDAFTIESIIKKIRNSF